MKKAVILLGSPHRDGNTAELAKAFAEGAAEKGAHVEIMYLSDMSVNYCTGCDYCRKNNGDCIQRDAMDYIGEKIEEADVVALATPLYFMTISAQLKTCIDRLYGRYHAKRLGDNKTGALLVTSGGPFPGSADDISRTFDAMMKLLRWENGGFVWTGGYPRDGSIKSGSGIPQARDLGRKLLQKGSQAAL